MGMQLNCESYTPKVNMPTKKKGKKGDSRKKKGKEGGKMSLKSRAIAEGFSEAPVDNTIPLLRTGVKLVNLLTSHPADKKEVHGIKVTARVLKHLTPKEIRDLRDVFDIYDHDSDGLIGPKYLCHALRALGFNISKDEAVNVIQDVNLKGSSEVNFSDFLEIVIDRQGEARDIYDEILKGFEMFDFDGTGKISVEKLRHTCTEAGVKLTHKDLEEMIQEADQNGDGHVDQSEFIKIMLQTNLF